MANITTTEAVGFIPEIWAASALGYLKSNTVMARLVSRDYENLVAKQGDIINIPRRGGLTVRSKSANAAVTLDTPAADVVQVTLDKHKYIAFMVEDIAAAQANQSIIDGYVMDGIKKIGEQIDSDLLALYSGFSTTPIDGTAGITAATVVEARRLLNDAKVPQEGRNIVWHQDGEAELLQLAQFTNAQYDPRNSDALANATLGRKWGFNHYMDQVVTATGGECKNIAFHRDAIALVTRPLAPVPANMGAQSVTMSEDGIGLRVTYSYNPSHLAMQVVIDLLYGVAELRDDHAVVIRSLEA